ncbi:MAG: 30S ribosomal protein S1, partial [Rhodobacteraceae bacterium]|nr:30S ribosomal protein S1 [Paracoccaceae bacterium]
MNEVTDKEQFEALLDESFLVATPKEKSVVKGTIIAIEGGQVVVDIGFKVEGHIDLREFSGPGADEDVDVGDEVDVYLDSVEDGTGFAAISRERARREAAWDRLELADKEKKRIEGVIYNRVKGGFTVDLGGLVAFLPGSQADIRPVRDADHLMKVKHEFQILKMDRSRNNIVISRRAILEEKSAELRAEVVNRLQEGDVIEAIVKNITSYGAFMDLGGVDGLLHITDMAWRRVSNPSEVLEVGDTAKVKIIKINRESQRISLGIKQLQEDPWQTVEEKFPVRTRHAGRVTNITDYGAFVELEPGIEGLVHISEMSWVKKNIHPGKILSTSQEVEVMILDIDKHKRRISLGLKQTERNPWERFAEENPPGTVISGEIRNIAEFGLFVGLDYGIDGMCHLSDMSWDRPGDEAIRDYRKGETVSVLITDVNIQRERVALSIKGLSEDPFRAATKGLRRGAIIPVTVSRIENSGIEVEYEGLTCFIRRGELSQDRSEQRPERFSTGDVVDVQVSRIDYSDRRLLLSIRGREKAEAQQAVEQYGSEDSGASLGEVIGDA